LLARQLSATLKSVKERLSPSDSLWLAILEREPRLQAMNPDEVRKELKASEFPERIVEAFLASRSEDGQGRRKATR
jgi:hypothetical protein